MLRNKTIIILPDSQLEYEVFSTSPFLCKRVLTSAVVFSIFLSVNNDEKIKPRVRKTNKHGVKLIQHKGLHS